MTDESQTGAELLRSYGPLAAIALAFILIGAFVSPTERDRTTVFSGAPTPSPVFTPGSPVTAPPAGDSAGAPNQANSPPDDSGQTTSSTPADAGPTSPTNIAGPAPGPAPGGYVPPGAQLCADRQVMVPGDPYSPPCYAFAGDNGGETTRGVSADEIVVSLRQLEGPTAAEIFASISGQDVNSSPEAARDTTLALVDYFNERFQFYGRKLRVEFFDGQGSGSNELLGGGREQARSDAVKAAQEVGAFVDASALTLPYADALAQQKVVNLGAPYPSQQWFAARAPYSWSIFPDGTNVVDSASAVAVARLVGTTADHAGDNFKGKKRVFGLVAPENAEYQESVNLYVERLRENGIEFAVNLKYKVELNSMPNQATNIIAQLKDAGVSSVVCGCDPIMLAVGMTPKANEQSYFPEWLTAGLAFVDQDLVGQLMDERQWVRAFGIAYNAAPEPLGGSYAYAAFKTQRPDDEPAFGVDEIYYQLYMMVIGIHMAGPDLTPETYQRGMFNYPGGTGPRGLWTFGPGDWTSTDDFREIWWDPNKISEQNGKPGAWVELAGGARTARGQTPRSAPNFFEKP